MTRVLAVLLAAVSVVAALSILWYRAELADSRLEAQAANEGRDAAVEANRSANATINALQRSDKITIDVTVDWSAVNDTLANEGRDAAVAITEAHNDDPATDTLDAPLPDSVAVTLHRLRDQAVAAASGRRPISGAVVSPGASTGTSRNPAAPQGQVDPAQVGEVGR